MNKIFENFDFSLLENREFKEDSVREEITSPLLKYLGYSASGVHKIIRSKSLEHPYVYIGTIKKGITIIPDYLLQFNGANFCIIDAKAPWENIKTGKNVEQAFSYAIHKDIRVNMYGLCNGKEIIIFHISKMEPIFYAEIKAIDDWINILEKIIGVNNRSKTNPEVVYKPDFGLYILKSGLAVNNHGVKIGQMFISLAIGSISMLENDLFSINAVLGGFDGEELMMTIDFNRETYEHMLTTINPVERNIIINALRMQPFTKHYDNGETCCLSFSCEIGNKMITNENESYIPMGNVKFFNHA